MAGRQTLQRREKRSEPVCALLGTGPDVLSPSLFLFPSAAGLQLQLEPSAKAGAFHCPTGTLLSSVKKTAGSGCSNARSSKGSTLPACGHADCPSLPTSCHLHQDPTPFSSLGAMVATSPSAPAPATLPESFLGLKMHKAPPAHRH